MRGERWWRTGERHEPPVPAARVRPHPTVPGAAVSRVQWQSPAKPGRPARQRAVIQLCWAGCAPLWRQAAGQQLVPRSAQQAERYSSGLAKQPEQYSSELAREPQATRLWRATPAPLSPWRPGAAWSSRSWLTTCRP